MFLIDTTLDMKDMIQIFTFFLSLKFLCDNNKSLMDPC